MGKKQRRSMGNGAGAAASAAKTKANWLKVPKGVKMWKEEEDTTARLDIIPYIVKHPEKHPDSKFIPEDLWFRFPYRVHRRLGPDKRDLVCPRTFGNACYACEERQRIYDDPDGDDDIAKALSASNRILYYVVPKGKKDPSVPHIWDISWFCFGKQLDREIDYGEEEYQNFADLEGGYTLLIRFDKETIGSGSFAKAGRIDFKERKDYTEEDIKELPCLSECLIIPFNKEIEAAMLGDEVEPSPDKDNEAWEEDEKPKSRKGKGKKGQSKKKKPEPEPEPEPEEEKEEESGKYDYIKKWSELEELDFDELEELNEEVELEVEFEDLDYEEALKEIGDALGIEKPKKKKGGKKKEEAKSGKGKKEKKSEKGKCPHGYTFGDDFEEKDKCEDCDLADDCFEASL